MKTLIFLALALIIAVSLIPQGRAAEANGPAPPDSVSKLAPEACLRKVIWQNLREDGQLKARWFNILNFCYNGLRITDWQLRWRPRIFAPEWRFIRLLGPRIAGHPSRAMFFQTEGIFRDPVAPERHLWRALLWQRAFPNGRWVFGGRQLYE